MKATKLVLEGIKKALKDGEATISFRKEDKKSKKEIANLDEASALTGSGLDVGGKTYFDEAFAALRYANPFRIGSRQIAVTDTSAVQFVAKVGNATNSTSGHNPWGYTFTPNNGNPNYATNIWQLPTRVISAQLPIRTAVLSDVNYLEEAIVKDLFLEFSQLEAASMAQNNDQAGSTTITTGATDGLRGLTVYQTSTSAASYGTSGTLMTNGIHTVLYESYSSTAPTYDDLVNTLNLLPAQYWYMPGTAWHMHPALIALLRKVHDTAGLPILLEVGDGDGGAAVHIFGIPVIPNPYLAAPGAGKLMGVLANWEQFYTIADAETWNLKMFDQTQPGFVTLYAEERLASSIRNPYAGVFIIGA